MTIDEYIAGFPEPIQQRLFQLRDLCRTLIPGATEKISYGMPTFHLQKNIVHFAAFKNHIGLYPLPETIKKFQEDLAGYHTAKGSIQFQHTEPLPLDLIRRIVESRRNEVLSPKS